MTPDLIFSIVPRLLPTFILGIVALVGLLLQRKTMSETISGTVKTMVGVIVLFAGVDLLVNAMNPLATLFGKVYASQGQAVAADWVGFLGQFGVEIVLVMVFGFLVNLALARFTPLKYVFLTGHILFWNAFMVTAALADAGKISGVALVVVGSIVLGLISTILPALISKFVFALTGSRDFTIGHTTTIHAFLGALVGKLVGKGSKSLEEVKVPERWSFLKSMTISTAAVMFILYLVMGWISGTSFAAATFTGSNTVLWYFWAFFQALLFAAGLTVLLTGVRMMLAEIIPAFHGLAQKIVPNAVPALDCPMIFPYGQNSLAIGFPIAMVFSLITLVIFGLAGFQYVLLPLVTAAFFDVGPGVILANATGGRRGALVYAALGGVLLIVLQAAALPFVMNSAAGFVNLFGGNDFSVIAIVVGGISRLLGF
ncbi:MAG: PTS ascorbate transporter subunit IIC [Chloroflexi bacterium HGW-Chloroflexi-10]|nr:MAG: PTS ascorbate transporter subunit IIC [Chloroflexi bacterium HGW-Chloroflexi-10]